MKGILDLCGWPGLIQVAGVRNLDEARMLVNAGAHWLGFPLRLAVHPEDLPDDEVSRIVQVLGLKHRGVLITYLSQAAEILSLLEHLGIHTVQLHGNIPSRVVNELKQCRPGLVVIKSLIVARSNFGELVRQMEAFAPVTDAFITDTFDPETGACGATGKTHDWSVSRELVRVSPRPVLLAGGLTPQNVRRAILEVQPYGVDAHTGLERRDGSKDLQRVQAFVKEARQAFVDLYGPLEP